jgi:hypothetical protein
LATDVCGQVLGFSRPFKVAVFITASNIKVPPPAAPSPKPEKRSIAPLTLSVNFLLLIPSFTP